MKLKNSITRIMAVAAVAASLNGCIDEVTPLDTLTKEQVESSTSSLKALFQGVLTYTNKLNAWGATDDYYSNYMTDYGYPCQMVFRDVLTGDFPMASKSKYSYNWSSVEQSTELRYTSYFSYNYYYRYVKNCNEVISRSDTLDDNGRIYYGNALVFRALCYFDMARMYEFKPTGYAQLDNAAESNNIWGATVPIVTDKTTESDTRNNPRAPFYTMYRFILSDLKTAESCLRDYSRPNGNYADLSVVYGMMARYWLEVGTRFMQSDADLQAQLSHEGDNDGYCDLGVSSATDCFKLASKYAQKAEQGYTVTTEDEWRNSHTGFNTATNAWMWYCSVNATEQEGYYYSSLLGTLSTEATWGMPQEYDAYREISSSLFGCIANSSRKGYDWRRKSWIAPEDTVAYKATDNEQTSKLVSKYNLAVWSDTQTGDDGNDSIITHLTKFGDYPAYSNLKFRVRDNISYIQGLLCDLPMMRVEEMYLIDAEAMAYVEGYAAGQAKLKSFLESYRYEGTYQPYTAVNSIESFQDEIFRQKRIEFWGEGLSYFDYKRLKRPVLRSTSDNYTDSYKQDSKDGYVCPAMNLYIPDYAIEQNEGLVLNPNCSGWNEME